MISLSPDLPHRSQRPAATSEPPETDLRRRVVWLTETDPQR
jgi:hypothetical protein